MESIQFYLPVRIVFGRDCVLQQAPGLFREQGQKALIVTGRFSAKKNGALDDVEQVLKQNQQTYVLFDQVESNPSMDCVYEGAALARQVQADFIIAIGGGSPMDAAKAIALLACQDIPKAQLFTQQPRGKTLPLICIPTTAGTGSEVTQYSVLTNDAQKTKTSLAAPCLFPQAALLDGKYMMRLPRTATIHTALDAFSHLVESALSKSASVWSKKLALKGIKMLQPYLSRLDASEWSLEDRDALLQTSLLGGVVIAQTSTTAVHLMGYPLTYFHHIDHGRANALLLCAYLEKVEKHEPASIQEILDALQLENLSQLNSIMDRLLGPKETISLEEAKQFASAAIQSPKSQSGIISLTQEDIENIYCRSFHLAFQRP